MNEEDIIKQIVSGELTWEGLIRDIIIDEGLDPWNIDIVVLANRFKSIVDKIDIATAGKFILVSSILLSMKSERIFQKEEEEIEELILPILNKREIQLKPRIPAARKRPITLNELIAALKKAVEVKERREKRKKEKTEEFKPKAFEVKKVKIGELIQNLYDKLVDMFKKFEVIPFSKLVPSWNRKDIVWTFLPLIHLSARHKVRLDQEEDFGEIYVKRESGD